MTAPEIVLVAAASWSIVAIALGLPLGRFLRKQDDTQRAAYPPPVPPSSLRATDSTWLDQWPSAVDDADLLDREFTSLISTTWEWPDTHEDAA